METLSEAEARRVVAQLRELVRAFQAGGRTLISPTNDELLETIVEAAARIFGAAASSIALIDAAGQQLVFRVAHGAGHDQIVGMRIPIHQGIAGYVAMTGEPLAISNVRTDPRFAQTTAQQTGYVPKSILAMPLLYGEQVIGVIEVLDKIDAAAFGMQEMELLGLFARQAAVAIHQSEHMNLLGLGLLHSLERLAGSEFGSDLRMVLADLVQEANREAVIPNEAHHDLVGLADLFYRLSHLGVSERLAAFKVLTAFADYAESKTPRANYDDSLSGFMSHEQPDQA